MSMTKSLLLAVSAPLIALSCGLGAIAQDDISFNLSAIVQSSCNVENVEALTNAPGSILRVTTICNSPSFTLNFGGVENLNVSTAQSAQNEDNNIILSSDVVQISPARPGVQTVDIAFGNELNELSDLTIDVFANQF